MSMEISWPRDSPFTIRGHSTTRTTASTTTDQSHPAARVKDMTVIALTGNTGGKMRDRLTETDVHICVPHERTARIQEIHLLVLHCLCDAVDTQLLGEEEDT